jgi:DNA gyrase subunit B
MTVKKKSKSNYTAENIKVLHGLEGIRERFDMYIGSRENGVTHLIKETITNSIDEFMNGFCKNIAVNLHPNNIISIIDDGRGMPVDYHKEEKAYATEVLFTNLHSGGKFDKDSFKVSAGKNGIGIKAVNALSIYTEVEVFKPKGSEFEGHYHQRFEKGNKATELVKKANNIKRQGTIITFQPDPEIFKEDVDVKWDEVLQLCEEFSYVNAGLTITCCNYSTKEKAVKFCHPEGIKELVTNLNGQSIIGETIFFNTESNGDYFEVAMNYNKGEDFVIKSFVNGISTPNGGTHETGFKLGLTSVVSKAIMEGNLLNKKDKDLKIEGDDTREGLTVVINLRHHLPEFRGQTKDELSNKEVQGVLQKIINSEFSEYLAKNKDKATKVFNKAIMAARSRVAGRLAKNRVLGVKGPAFLNMANVTKLSDCSSKDITENELFIVEGELLNCPL